MDPRHRADEALDRARARGAFVVTPDNATSPMDASTTVRIPREVVASLSEDDPDSTLTIRRPDQAETQHSGWPTEDYGEQEASNQYHYQNEFGFGPQPTQQFPR